MLHKRFSCLVEHGGVFKDEVHTAPGLRPSSLPRSTLLWKQKVCAQLHQVLQGKVHPVLGTPSRPSVLDN